jgi:ABC-type polysaccharide/polyol phosphate export permease
MEGFKVRYKNNHPKILLPLTYTVDGLKNCLLEDKGTIPIYLDLLILLGFGILLYGLSLFIFKKRIRQEF